MERDKCANVRVLVYKVQVRLRGGHCSLCLCGHLSFFSFCNRRVLSINGLTSIPPTCTWISHPPLCTSPPPTGLCPSLHCVQAPEALFLLDPHHNLVCQFLWCREFEKFHLLAKRLEQGSDHNPGLG